MALGVGDDVDCTLDWVSRSDVISSVRRATLVVRVWIGVRELIGD